MTRIIIPAQVTDGRDEPKDGWGLDGHTLALIFYRSGAEIEVGCWPKKPKEDDAATDEWMSQKDSWVIVVVNPLSTAPMQAFKDLLGNIDSAEVFAHFATDTFSYKKSAGWIEEQWESLKDYLNIKDLSEVSSWAVMPYTMEGKVPWYEEHLKFVAQRIRATASGANALKDAEEVVKRLEDAWRQVCLALNVALPEMGAAKTLFPVYTATAVCQQEPDIIEKDEVRAVLEEVKEKMKVICEQYQAVVDVLNGYQQLKTAVDSDEKLEKSSLDKFTKAFEAVAHRVSTLVEQTAKEQ